jgi:hypothetical protein
MFNGITDEAMLNDGTKFVLVSVTSFVIKFISYNTTSLGQNSIHYYFLFVFKFVVWVVWIPMAMLFGISCFIALTTNHIYPPSFVNFFLLSWWF